MIYPILVPFFFLWKLRLGEQTQGFQKLFAGDIFAYLLNIFVTAAPMLKQKISKIIFQF